MTLQSAQADVLTDLSSIESIKDEWRRLAEERSNAFITPEWFFTWFDHYGDEYMPVVSVVYFNDGKLAGLMPLALSRSRWLRKLCFAGANLGDYFHPVSKRVDEETVAAATAAALGGQRHMWSMFILDNVEVSARWPGAMAQASPRPLASLDLRTGSLPYISFEGQDWGDFQKSRRRSIRRERGRQLRRLEGEHRVSFRRTESSETLTADIETFFQLHDLRRDQLGGSSLSSSRARAFLRDFAVAALQCGWLRLFFMEIDGKPVAAEYDWRVGDSYASYQTGFDPAWSRHGVGALLEDNGYRTAIEEGASTFEMLLGDEPYKLRQATYVREVHTVAVVRSKHPARILAGVEVGLRRTAGALPPRWREKARELAGALIRQLPSARRR